MRAVLAFESGFEFASVEGEAGEEALSRLEGRVMESRVRR
jgi:hypothetical protein